MLTAHTTGRVPCLTYGCEAAQVVDVPVEQIRAARMPTDPRCNAARPERAAGISVVAGPEARGSQPPNANRCVAVEAHHEHIRSRLRGE